MQDDAPPRLSSDMRVAALLRSVQAAGGFATVLHRGDASAGAILIEWRDRGALHGLVEGATMWDGAQGWRAVVSPQVDGGTPDDAAPPYGAADPLGDYRQRRRRADPDMWIIELDIAQPQRFIADMTPFA